MNEKKYTIDGKIYIQRPIVLGQLVMLIEELQGMEINDMSAIGLIRGLGGRLPLAMAIVLTPDGIRIKDKDVPAVADELERTLDIDTAMEVIEDFFSFNPISSISRRMKGAMIMTIDAASEILSGTVSSRSSKTSASAISPEKIESSGG